MRKRIKSRFVQLLYTTSKEKALFYKKEFESGNYPFIYTTLF